jgi:AraC family transcriptional regulator
MELQTHGRKKYPKSSLLISSAGRGWSAISAELRAHAASEGPGVAAQELEIAILIRGNEDGLVSCKVGGRRQPVRPTTGSIWLSPIDVGADEISIAAPRLEAIHLYIPAKQFALLAEEYELPRTPSGSIRSAYGVQDEMIRQIGLSILSEMTCETAAGRMLVETSSLLLAARLAHTYADSISAKPRVSSRHRLDNVRLRRVLDYVEQHLEADITVEDLANVACLSTCHFARMFASAVGLPPHRYVSQQRLKNAMALLAGGKSPLSDIALRSRFSSQASFNRAFRRATGMTPGEYRRRLQ